MLVIENKMHTEPLALFFTLKKTHVQGESHNISFHCGLSKGKAHGTVYAETVFQLPFCGMKIAF